MSALRKHILLIAAIALYGMALGQQTNSGYLPGDSVFFQGKFYAPKDYEKLRKQFVNRNFETYTMPGVSYTVYQPNATDSLGTYQGITVEYLLFAKVHNDNDPGPSQVRVYIKTNILNSTKKEVPSLFGYSVGVDLSLEKNPKRAVFVPYFGLEAGMISQKTFRTSFQFTPTVGIHIISSKYIFVNTHVGYMYPLSNFEMLQGWFGQAGIDFSLW